MKNTVQELIERREAMLKADMGLRAALIWEGSRWGEPDSLAWSVQGAIDRIIEKREPPGPAAKPSRVFKINDGAVWLIAATTLTEAIAVLESDCVEDLGPEDIEALTIEVLDEARARAIMIGDDEGGQPQSAWDSLQDATQPCLLGGSEF